MADDEPERPDLQYGPISGDESKQAAVLTVNQLVAYNLMRARRRKAWTQQETAERLTERTTRKWTAATLSAAERSWQTGRSRQFDANELAAFAAIFGCPIPYFFVPIKPEDGHLIWYALSKVDEALEFPILETKELLDAAVPLRYPSSLVDEVNALRRMEGLNWNPSADVDWFRPEEHVSPEAQPRQDTPDEDPWEAYQEREWHASRKRHEDDIRRLEQGKRPSREYLMGLVMSRLSDSVYKQAKEIVDQLEEALPPPEDPEGHDQQHGDYPDDPPF